MKRKERKLTTATPAPTKPEGFPLCVPKELVINWLRRGSSAAREMFPAFAGSTEELITELEAHVGEILVPDVGLLTRAEFEEFEQQFWMRRNARGRPE